MKNIRQTLASLKFNKLKNKYEKESERRETAAMAAFLTLPNADLVGEVECCVCFETTVHKTACDHGICVPCADQIKKVSDPDGDEYDEDDEATITMCPLCRKDISDISN